MSQAVQASSLRDWIIPKLDPLEDREPLAGVDFIPDGPGLLGPESVRAGVLIGVVERAGGPTVLLTRRADTLRTHKGQVAFPGGRCDPGETPWAAAVREAEEEIGLDRSFVDPVGLATPMATGSGYLVYPVVAFVREGFTLSANPHEVADIFEAPFELVVDPANYQTHYFELPEGRSGHYEALIHEEQRIWGVTGRILRALHGRLYGGAPG